MSTQTPEPTPRQLVHALYQAQDEERQAERNRCVALGSKYLQAVDRLHAAQVLQEEIRARLKEQS